MFKQFFSEFRKFISRGNAIDMAVGFMMGTAFSNITNSLVNDIFMPILSKLMGGIDLTSLNICLQKELYDTKTGEIINEGIYLGIGTLLATLLEFVIIAFVLFCMIKGMNTASQIFLKKKEKEEAAKGPSTEELLADILAEMKKNKKK